MMKKYKFGGSKGRHCWGNRAARSAVTVHYFCFRAGESAREKS